MILLWLFTLPFTFIGLWVMGEVIKDNISN